MAFGDYDNDGYLDIYVSCGGTDSDILWHNNGNGTFTDVSVAAGISDNDDGRSCLWFDVDNDGDLDIYVANAGSSGDFLYINNGNGTFRKLVVGPPRNSYGCAVADYDHDGDLDIVVTGDSNFLTLYENQCPNRNHISVRPTDSMGRRTCFGALVLLRDHVTKALAGMVQIDGGSGRGCQSQYDAHFGVPNSTNQYDIEVRLTRNEGGQQVVVDGAVNPDLDGVSAGNIDLGYIEVRENGRVTLSHGIAYTHDSGSGKDIFAIPKLGGSPVQLTTNAAADTAPSWAPDGQKLVFSSHRDTGLGANDELYTIRADGANETRLVPQEWSTSNETSPAWSSDATQIAFVTDKDGNREIYVSNTAGTETRNLTDNPADDTCPAWNANSSKIAFATNRVDGDWDVYVMNFDGSNPFPLSDIDDSSGEPPYPLQNNGHNDVDPAWHPNGLYLVFSTNRDGGVYQIYTMQFDGTLQQAVTSGGSDKHHPVFTARGDEIIYETNGEIHIMDFPTGANDRVLTDAGTGNSEPHYPLLFRQPPRTIMFGVKDGRVMYWADPVNTQLGNFTRAETDFMLPGFGDPVVWSRTYNSQDTLLGPLGYGWRFNYQIAVTEDADGATTVTWGNGTQDFFRKNVDGQYVPLEDRTTHTFVKNPDASYTLTTREGTVFDFFGIGKFQKSFDPSILGQVRQITDKNGNKTWFTYASPGLLTQVSQDNGRNLVVTWETHPTYGHRITRVQENIPGLTTPRSVVYEYDANGDLVRATGRDGMQYVRFAYDANHRITDVFTLFDGSTEVHTVHNEYDQDGRIALQRDANGNESTIGYTENAEGLETTVTDARSNAQKHIYDKYRRLTEYHDEGGGIIQYRYDPNGFKTHIVDRDGNTFRFPENEFGQPVKAEDPLGNTTQVGYGSDGNPASRTVTPEPGVQRTTHYTYDAQGNLSSVLDGLGHAASTRYNARGQPIEIEDELGNVTTLIYDPATGDLSKIRNALGYETTLEHDARGRLTKVIDALGNTVEYGYRDDDQQSLVRDPKGSVTAFDYYTGGQLKKVTNALGHESSFTYDDNLNVNTATDPRGHVTAFGYDANNNVVSVSDTYQGVPRQTSYVYDAQNRLVSVTDAEGNTNGYSYDAHGRVIKVTDPRGQAYEKEYDEAGRVTRTFTVLGGETIQTTYEYNAANELIRQVDTYGRETRYEYDSLGRLAKTIDDAGNETTTEYYAASEPGAFYGKIKRTVDINGRQIRYEYNAIGQLVDQYDNINRRKHYEYDEAGHLSSVDEGPVGSPFVTRYEYDPNGNAIKTVNPANDVAETEYDVLNRVLKAYLPYPLGGSKAAFTAYTYDETGQAGRLTRVVDPNGNATAYAHDEDGRARAVTDARGNLAETTHDRVGRTVRQVAARGSADESEVQYAYDANGNVTTITKIMGSPGQNQVQTFDYDLLNRMTKHTDALGRATTMEYNAIGLLTEHTTPDNLVTTYAYDNLYRVVTVNYPDGSHATHSYDDGNGHSRNKLSVANTALGTTTWSYDEMDRVDAVTDVWGKTVGYEYDHFNRVETLVYPGNLRVAYTYNNRHQIASVTDWLGNSAMYEYDDKGRLTLQANSNGTRTIWTYQDNGWLASLRNERTDHSTIAAYALATDPVGNRTQIVRDEPALPFPDPTATNSTFDKANQIQTDGETTYTFDARGNLETETRGTETITYQFDYVNRLLGVVSGSPASYQYDDAGNRVQATRVGIETRYTVDPRGMGWVVSENDTTNSPQWYYVYGNGLAWRINALTDDVQHYHGDPVGTVTVITDTASRAVQAYACDAFGEIVGRLNDNLEQPFQYVGLLGVQQEPNGLGFMKARFYHLASGAFLSVDPRFSLNPYAYCHQNPILMADPDGRSATLVGALLGAGIGAASYLITDVGSGEDFSWSALLGNAAGGAVKGAIYGALVDVSIASGGVAAPLAVTIGAGVGAGAGLAGTFANERIQGWLENAGLGTAQDFDRNTYVQSAVLGAAGGALGGVGGFVTTPYDRVWAVKQGIKGLSETTLKLLYPESSASDVSRGIGGGGGGGRLGGIPYSNSSAFGPASCSDPKSLLSFHVTGQAGVSLWTQGENTPRYDPVWEQQRRDYYERNRVIREYQAREAAVQASMSNFLRGRTWDQFSGRHGLDYAYVSDYGVDQSFLVGWWYVNESRIANMFIPGASEAATQKALSAHATLVNGVRTAILSKYGAGAGANGRNTPFIPEVYQIEVVEGKTQAFVK